MEVPPNIGLDEMMLETKIVLWLWRTMSHDDGKGIRVGIFVIYGDLKRCINLPYQARD